MIPAYTMATLDAYVKRGEHPGGFLMAVLINDLGSAVFRADSQNGAALAEIVQHIYFDTPTNCHGSQKLVEAWLDQKGLLAITDERLALMHAIDAANEPRNQPRKDNNEII